MESKDILAIAKKHRIAIKASPSANVEDKDVRKMMPLIDKYKAEAKSRDEEDRKKKDEERRAKEEERRRKEEERKKETEAKRKADEEQRRRSEESARTDAQKRAEEERKAQQQAVRAQREEDDRRRAEDERLRSLGLRVPKRPTAFRPEVIPPPPPPAPVAPPPAASAPSAPSQQGPRPGGGIRPGGGTGFTPRPGGSPGQGPRPGGGTGYQGQNPGGPRPGGFDRQGQGGPRPGGGQGYQGQNPGGPRPDRGPGGYQGQGGQRPGGYQGQNPGGPRPDRGPGGYQGQGGQRPGGYQGQGGPGGPRPGGYQGQGGPGGPRPGGYQGQGGPGGPRPGGYQGGQRPGGYQGQGGPGGPRPGGYQGGPGGPGGQRPGGYQGGPPRGDRPYPPRQDGGGGYGRRDDGGRTGPADLSEGNLPQIGVMRLDKPAGRGARTDRDRKPPAAADKKRGKVAPRKIFELDEDMTMTARPKVPGVPGRPAGGMDTRPGFGGRRRMGKRPKSRSSRQNSAPQQQGPRSVTIEGPTSVAEFAAKLNISPAEIIRKVLLDMGEALTMNAILSEDLMQLLAPEFNADLEIIPVGDEFDVEKYMVEDDESRMQRRPPVVTIMGHVDHGKTSLLDYIRSSKVVAGEFGGITQHIGAYHVKTAKGPIVFLDTPGHEAFTSMRARGAGVTDLVILVVAANDGFKPQTIEALNHAKAAKVPLVVAVNKIDLPGADGAKVRQEALQHNLVPEEFGGDTIFVDISAKQGTNVDQLLEMVALQSEILDLKADAGRPAVGTIIESHVDPTRGAVATVLVQKGTLRAGDYFVSGDISGRVRAMVNDRGKTVKEAGPSFPAEIIGLAGSPPAGETFLVMPDEATAREVANKREIRRRASSLAPTTQKHITLEHLHEYIEEGKTQDLSLILKADVQGSIEAVRQSLEKLSNPQIRIRVLHAAVGGINESDVQLAAASDAIIIGFNVRPEVGAQELSAREGVEIKLYRIIYDLIDEVKQAMTGMLAPTFREKVLGHAEVRQLFKASRLGTIAGSYVRDGEIVRDSKVRIVRDNVVVYEGQLGSVRRVKEDVKKVAAGAECGITIENFNDIKEGDIIESYEMEQIASTLEPANA